MLHHQIPKDREPGPGLICRIRVTRDRQGRLWSGPLLQPWIRHLVRPAAPERRAERRYLRHNRLVLAQVLRRAAGLPRLKYDASDYVRYYEGQGPLTMGYLDAHSINDTNSNVGG